ncbi:MAG: polyamine aminopropyltransferase [Fervidicoccaceae archaeon]
MSTGNFNYYWNWFVEWIADGDASLRASSRVYAFEKTPYQSVMVVELVSLGKTLIIDGKVQSSLYDEHIYHESLVHPPLITHGLPEKVLILGGGEGATLREVLRYRTVREVHMVDIDEKVVEFSRNFLKEWHRGAFDDPRTRIIIADGRKFVEEAAARGEKYDAVIIDLVDPLSGGPAVKLYTREFYHLIEKILEDDGVMVTQATSPILYQRMYAVILNTVASAFSIARPYLTYIRSYNGPWGFVYGSNKKDPLALQPEEINKRISSLLSTPSELKFYDGETHEALFKITKNIRDGLKSWREVSTDESPKYIDI